MEICITFGGRRHCFYLPIIQVPVHWPGPGPGPVNYPALFQDAIIVASLGDLTKHINDAGVRTAVQHGLTTAVKGMQERAGKDVTINATAQG